MLSVKNARFRYRGNEQYALREINLDAAGGDFIGVIGPGGAGKTTLTRAINGVVPHRFPGDFFGAVTVNGLDTIDAGPETLAREVGSVFQDIDGQMVATVVEDEILFGLENFGVPREEIEDRLETALDSAGIGGLRNRTLSSLSGGQKQKVAIAAITALRPSIILLDEPTGELDPRSSRRVFEYLKKLNEERGITIIIVEQKIMLLCEFAKRLAVMDGGRLILEGSVAEVLARGKDLEAAGVNIPRVSALAARLRENALYTGDPPVNLAQAETMAREVLAKTKIPRAPPRAVFSPAPPARKEEDILRFDHVSFSYGAAEGKPETIRGVSFRLETGAFAALLGENGAGKSTLARLCNGLLKPSTGSVLVSGVDTRTVKTSALARKAGFLFQNPDRQICCNTVREEILFGLKNILPDDKAEQERRCAETLDRFSLDGGRDPFGISRGERQIVALASVLALKPELLILDEPATGLDYRECVMIMDLIAELNAAGTTILMITHDMEVACDYAKRALILSKGTLVGDCSMRKAMKNRTLLEGASLLPAQIPALAMSLGAGFEDVYTVDEMAAALAGEKTTHNLAANNISNKEKK